MKLSIRLQAFPNMVSKFNALLLVMKKEKFISLTARCHAMPKRSSNLFMHFPPKKCFARAIRKLLQN
jgi:hypothetical protein